nr:hypothetical protein [Actinomyces sp.]
MSTTSVPRPGDVADDVAPAVVDTQTSQGVPDSPDAEYQAITRKFGSPKRTV